MSEINKGVLFFKEWLESMEKLSPREYKKLASAIYQYQINDVPPPPFTGMTEVLSTIIFPCIKRRKGCSSNGRLGADARYGRTESASKNAKQSVKKKQEKSPAPAPLANGVANSVANGVANGQRIEESSKEKKNKEELSKAESSKAESSKDERSIDEIAAYLTAVAPEGEERAADADALAQYKARTAFLKKGYGCYGNVYLSEEEYDRIKSIIPDADGYIDKFSRKLHVKGYQYGNHAEALLDWWKKDSSLPVSGQRDAPQPAKSGTFDTDEFFRLAVKKSLGECTDV